MRNETGRKETAWSQMVTACLSLLFFVFAVYGSVVQTYEMFDRRAAVLPHGLVSGLIVWSGVWLGIGLAPPRLLAERKRWQPFALLALVLGMGATAITATPTIDVFVDAHAALLVESQVLAYGMGVISGIAWQVLLSDFAWYGLLLTPVGILMMQSGVLASYSW